MRLCGKSCSMYEGFIFLDKGMFFFLWHSIVLAMCVCFFFPNYLFWHLRLEVFSLQSTSKVCWYQQTPSRSDYAVQLRDPRFHVRKFEEERKWNGMECFMIGSNTRQRENNPGKNRSENTPASGVSLNIPSLRPVKSIS